MRDWSIRLWPVLCVGLLSVSASAEAQCESQWWPHPGAGLNWVSVFTVWRGDLVAWGSITPVGGSPIDGLDRWDGATWSLIASGLSPGPGFTAPDVNAMSVYGQNLILGGYFDTAGGTSVSNIVGWDGASWYALGSGLGVSSYEGVRSLAEYEGELYVGGLITQAGGQPASRIARWDGTSWSPVGSGANGPVEALAVFQGDLIAGGNFNTIGGQFTTIGRWDGTQWHAMNLFGTVLVTDLLVHSGQLYAAIIGDFGLSGVERWTGSEWIPVAPYSNTWNLYSLSSHDGDLIGGGVLTSFAPPGYSAIRRWSSSSWASLGSGIPEPATVYALETHDHVLYVGGNFQTAGGLPSPHWARWGCACYADCNNSSSLTIADFGCFQAAFAAGDPYADCNNSSSLTIADFGCFQAKFAAGCP